jgi:peptidoglycan/LPS O-acetylase OafA/YrhL
MLKNSPHSDGIITHKRIFGLDLMRACSIIMVFLAHSAIMNPLNGHFLYLGWMGFGVEAFFVLSGFLIGRIILKTLFRPGVNFQSIKVFWMNRWLRTIPAYFFTLIIYYAVNSVPRNSFTFWLFCQNLITPIPGFFVHSWSLAVEEWFYLIFPIFLWGITFTSPKRQSKLRTFMLGIVAFVLFGLVSKTLYHVLYKNGLLDYLLYKKLVFPSWNKFLTPHGHWDEMRKIVPFRIDAIAYGCLIAYCVEKFGGISKRHSIFLFLMGIVGLFGSYWILSETVAGSGANFFADVFLLPLFCVSFALMIPFAIICPEPNKFIHRIVTTVSLTSYSFYLIHFLILDSILESIFNVEGLTPGLKSIVLTGTYSTTFLASYLMYRFIEIPFMNYRRRLSANMT